ncbi:nuclear body protein SP140-like protein isoform X2 [Paralichthys olivaceus]|uniref:nuclear body protein SP140-like protein isoform X2 n=1 Tax=Paralichthys olivaceus TaxID=8255 RepID=UPI00375123C8
MKRWIQSSHPQRLLICLTSGCTSGVVDSFSDGPAVLPEFGAAAALLPLSQNRDVVHGRPGHLPPATARPQPAPRGQVHGPFQFYTELPEKEEKEETDERKRKELSEDEEEEEEQVSSVKKKRKLLRKSLCEDDDEQQPGPSCQLTPRRRKKSGKVCLYSPLKKGEKRDIWTWPIFKSQLPVTCGSQEGILSRERLAKGESCIMFQKKWFTPAGFEKSAGKGSSKNWKFSIRCMGTPLARLIDEGNLTSANYRRGKKVKSRQAKRSLFSSETVSEEEEDDDENEDEEVEDLENQTDNVSYSDKENSSDVPDEDRETEEQTEQEPEVHKVFKVACGDATGTLHQKRFGSGTRGKCIRTERSWLTPMEFLKETSSQSDLWRKEIMFEGQPLCALIEAEVLKIHSLLCKCRLCKPNKKDLEDQINDDECCVCKRGEADLVLCDSCPCSFHQKCHLPHVDDNLLKDNRPWMCTFCVTFQEWRFGNKLEITAALSHQISDHILECQYLVLHLYSADDQQIFGINPSLSLENYSTYVKTPMWLERLAEKLQGKEYRTVGDFVSDVQLIFTNFASYNQANPDILVVGDRLKQLFHSEFRRVFNISEES